MAKLRMSICAAAYGRSARRLRAPLAAGERETARSFKLLRAAAEQ